MDFFASELVGLRVKAGTPVGDGRHFPDSACAGQVDGANRANWREWWCVEANHRGLGRYVFYDGP